MMSMSELSEFWDAAAQIGASEFIVRRTMEQLNTHEIGLCEAIEIVTAFVADHVCSTESRSAVLEQYTGEI